MNENFEVHSTLNPRLWTSDNKLRDDVKERLLEIVQQFMSQCEIPLIVLDVHLVGSNVSYNYTDHSDLDLHIVANFELVDARTEILQFAYNTLRSKFNSEYNISIRGIDVEVYVEDVNSTVLSNGIYSLYKDTWIKFPKPLKDVVVPDVTDEVSAWKQIFTSAIESNDSDKIEDAINSLYVIRKNSIDTEGEYGVGNQVFKEIRNLGLLDKAKQQYKVARSKELTLESFRLTEDSRVSILAKSKQSKKGFERFKKRVKSRLATSVKQYNSIDMNKLFKDDILTVDIAVKGETDDYTVKISFGGFTDLIYDQVKAQGKFNLKAVTRALVTGFNRSDVYINCSCADSKYRFAYWNTKNGITSGDPETRPANETNPDDTLGSACKHVLLVLSNTSWILRTAATVHNYVNYMEKHYDRLYKKLIYPAIYHTEYQEPEQLTLMDDELATDKETIDTSNKYARTKNQFKPREIVLDDNSIEDGQLGFDDLDDNI